MKVSVIIPTYNEEKSIIDCLNSLLKQTYKDMEIIVIDDGSTDCTISDIKDQRSKPQLNNLKLLTQQHQGPAVARNLGAKHAIGEILVFVDADMAFDKKFIEMLTRPIRAGKTIGTFSKDEYVLNKENVWSKCWNINKNLPTNKMHPENYPNHQPVFRAILKREFIKSGGFKPIGYIDDYTISEALGEEATVSPGAFFYHKNPQTLKEVFNQARWIGKSEYKRRKIKNENLMRVISIIRYSLPFTLIDGCIKAVRHVLPQYIFFKIVYDIAVEISLISSFFSDHKYK